MEGKTLNIKEVSKPEPQTKEKTETSKQKKGFPEPQSS